MGGRGGAILKSTAMLCASSMSLNASAQMAAAHSVLEPTPLYISPPGETRWASPENPSGAKGKAGVENRGAKGRAFVTLAPNERGILADVHGAGIIDRVWMTFGERTPQTLRSLRLEIFWDGAKAPAVSVPVGDFFLENSGAMVSIESALLSSPEGRSFVSVIPMPFRKRAQVFLVNDGATPVSTLFYDVDYRRLKSVARGALYFHAWWSRREGAPPGVDFDVLPQIRGHGRFLGLSLGVQSNPVYGATWWGEGEVRTFIDDDRVHPTLSGTGSEDYIGSGWGLGRFSSPYEGAPVADEARGQWSLYRFHVPDPIGFKKGLRVTYQDIGGAFKNEVEALQKANAPMIPVTVDPGSRVGFVQLLESRKSLSDAAMPQGWTNFYRSDDISAVAYFYLDRPQNDLAPIAKVAGRTRNLRPPQDSR